MKALDTSLYFITDSTGYTEEEFLYRVERALQGGAPLLQLREKEKSTREYMELAKKVHMVAKRYQVPLIIDDRVDVALAVDAEGVHVGADDMPVADARRLMGVQTGASARRQRRFFGLRKPLKRGRIILVWEPSIPLRRR